jgi:hypothetical protein
LLVSKPRRALVGVVELGEDHVKGRVGDSIGEANIGYHTLRSCGDQEARLHFLELVDEVGIVGVNVFLRGNFPCVSLQIQVETINKLVAERTGSGPF